MLGPLIPGTGFFGVCQDSIVNGHVFKIIPTYRGIRYCY